MTKSGSILWHIFLKLANLLPVTLENPLVQKTFVLFYSLARQVFSFFFFDFPNFSSSSQNFFIDRINSLNGGTENVRMQTKGNNILILAE